MGTFVIYPAIDIRGGACVRLVQGDFSRETVYHRDPVEMGIRWEKEGAEWLHVVDLDAARTGIMTNLPIIKKMIAALSIPVQVGGGVRNKEQLEILLEAGAARVVLGSAAVDHPDFVKEVLAAYPEQVVVGIDAREGRIATHGWLKTTEIPMEQLAKKMADWGAQKFIFTDIGRDGTLKGPNLKEILKLATASKAQVIASGGIRSLSDLQRLAQYQDKESRGYRGKSFIYWGSDLKEALYLLAKQGERKF